SWSPRPAAATCCAPRMRSACPPPSRTPPTRPRRPWSPPGPRAPSPVPDPEDPRARPRPAPAKERPMTDLFDLTGRTALVTGSTRGIGRSLAEGLALAGARVIVHGRDPERAAAAATEIAEAQGGAVTLSAGFDVTDPAAVDAALTAI